MTATLRERIRAMFPHDIEDVLLEPFMQAFEGADDASAVEILSVRLTRADGIRMTVTFHDEDEDDDD